MTVPSVDNPPAIPSLDDRSTFSTRTDGIVKWMVGDFFPYLEAAVPFVDDKASRAEAAQAGAEIAAGAADVSAWVSAASYTAGDIRYSPIDFKNYRAKTTHSGETGDPSTDATNWQELTLANVQSSAVDTTANRLLTVGAFGLGSDLPFVGDLDALDFTTLFASNTGTGLPESGNWVGRHLQHPNGDAEQEVTDCVNEHCWRRVKDGGTWGDWHRVWTGGDLLDAVAMTSGVPTGGVIERGSNANGHFVRFADGTQICTQDFLANAVTHIDWTFPAAFAAIDALSGGVKENSGSGVIDPATVCTDGVTTSAARVNLYDLDGSLTGLSKPFTVMAVGRWTT